MEDEAAAAAVSQGRAQEPGAHEGSYPRLQDMSLDDLLDGLCRAIDPPVFLARGVDPLTVVDRYGRPVITDYVLARALHELATVIRTVRGG